MTFLSSLAGPPSDKTTLIPLTSSLYVPGKLADCENVIVDVGTGYFVEKVSIKATIVREKDSSY